MGECQVYQRTCKTVEFRKLFRKWWPECHELVTLDNVAIGCVAGEVRIYPIDDLAEAIYDSTDINNCQADQSGFFVVLPENEAGFYQFQLDK